MKRIIIYFALRKDMINIVAVIIAKTTEIYSLTGIHTFSELDKIKIVLLTSELFIGKAAKLRSQMRYIFITDKCFCRIIQLLYLFSS